MDLSEIGRRRMEDEKFRKLHDAIYDLMELECRVVIPDDASPLLRDAYSGAICMLEHRDFSYG